MKLKEMIMSLGRDVDVCDDYTDDWLIAFVGSGNKPTKEGWEEFSSIMDLEVEIDGIYAIVKLNHLPDDVIDDVQYEVRRFFESHAGYCSNVDYEKWFGE